MSGGVPPARFAGDGVVVAPDAADGGVEGASVLMSIAVAAARGGVDGGRGNASSIGAAAAAAADCSGGSGVDRPRRLMAIGVAEPLARMISVPFFIQSARHTRQTEIRQRLTMQCSE